MEKICTEQFVDQWITKFELSPETFDKLVDELRPFVKKTQGILVVVVFPLLLIAILVAIQLADLISYTQKDSNCNFCHKSAC